MSYEKDNEDAPELTDTIKNLHEKLNREFSEEFNI